MLRSQVKSVAHGDRPRLAREEKLVREKMQEWIENGAQSAWLIDPEAQSASIYRADGTIETRSTIELITGEGLVAGFTLDLAFVWNPFAI